MSAKRTLQKMRYRSPTARGCRRMTKRLGKHDLLVQWTASRCPTWMSKQRWKAIAPRTLILGVSHPLGLDHHVAAGTQRISRPRTGRTLQRKMANQGPFPRSQMHAEDGKDLSQDRVFIRPH